MADTVQPVSKPVGKPDGLSSPSAYSTLTTPEPRMGNYFGSGMKGKDVVSRHNVMGKVAKKSKE